jgi:hypothetical protein
MSKYKITISKGKIEISFRVRLPFPRGLRCKLHNLFGHKSIFVGDKLVIAKNQKTGDTQFYLYNQGKLQTISDPL